MKAVKKGKRVEHSNKNKIIDFFEKNAITILIGVIIITILIIIVLNTGFFGSLNTESKKVKELYSYVSNDELNRCNGLINYQDKKVTAKDLSVSDKLCYVTNNDSFKAKKFKSEEMKVIKKDNVCSLGEGKVFATDNYKGKKCTVKKYDKKLINELYEKIYGETLKDENISFMIDDYNICYYHKDSYYCGLAESFTFTIGNDSMIYRIIDKAVEKGNTITIYDYFLKIDDNKCYTSYNGTNTNADCNNIIDEKTKINSKFIKKHGTLYKHEFTKKDGNDYYSWVSSVQAN